MYEALDVKLLQPNERKQCSSTLASSYPWYAYFGHTILRFRKGAILINKRCLPLVLLILHEVDSLVALEEFTAYRDVAIYRMKYGSFR